jgi:hypothetical protein
MTIIVRKVKVAVYCAKYRLGDIITRAASAAVASGLGNAYVEYNRVNNLHNSCGEICRCFAKLGLCAESVNSAVTLEYVDVAFATI